MSRLNFSKNWAGKLDNDFFTTVRRDRGYWQTKQDCRVSVYLKGKHKTEAIVIFVLPLELENINPALSHFDAGMERKPFVEMLTRMYGENSKLQLIGLQKV